LSLTPLLESWHSARGAHYALSPVEGSRASDQDFPLTTRAPRGARERLHARLQGGLVEVRNCGDGRQSRQGHGIRDDRRRARRWLKAGVRTRIKNTVVINVSGPPAVGKTTTSRILTYILKKYNIEIHDTQRARSRSSLRWRGSAATTLGGSASRQPSSPPGT